MICLVKFLAIFVQFTCLILTQFEKNAFKVSKVIRFVRLIELSIFVDTKTFSDTLNWNRHAIALNKSIWKVLNFRLKLSFSF